MRCSVVTSVQSRTPKRTVVEEQLSALQGAVKPKRMYKCKNYYILRSALSIDVPKDQCDNLPVYEFESQSLYLNIGFQEFCKSHTSAKIRKRGFEKQKMSLRRARKVVRVPTELCHFEMRTVRSTHNGHFTVRRVEAPKMARNCRDIFHLNNQTRLLPGNHATHLRTWKAEICRRRREAKPRLPPLKLDQDHTVSRRHFRRLIMTARAPLFVHLIRVMQG